MPRFHVPILKQNSARASCSPDLTGNSIIIFDVLRPNADAPGFHNYRNRHLISSTSFSCHAQTVQS